MTYLLTLLLAATAVTTQETPTPPAAAVSPSNNRSGIVIDPKARAMDYVQAFDLLRKEKPTMKITIRTANGMTLSNVTDLSVAQGGTLLIVKLLSAQGSKTQFLPVEEMLEISYSP